MSLKPFNSTFFLLAAWVLTGPILHGMPLISSVMAAEAKSKDLQLVKVIDRYREEGAAEALPEFERLLAELRRAGDRASEAEVQRYVGECHWRLGQFGESRDHLEAALSIARDIGQTRLEGRILNVFGLLEWDLGNYRAALENFDLAYTIAINLDDQLMSASVLNNRGLVKDELGEYADSLQDYQVSLALFEQEEDRRGQADALGNIGSVHLLLGRYGLALDYHRRALAISEELQSKPGMTIDHGNLALSLLGLGRGDEALDHFDRALELARLTGMALEEAYWQRGKGNALASQGHYDLSMELHRMAMATYEQTGARSLLLDAQHDMGMLMLTLGDPGSAESWFEKAVHLAREIGHERALTENLLALGDLQYRRKMLEEARQLYLQGLHRSKEVGEIQLATTALLRLASVDRAQGRYDDAARQASEALEVARTIDAVPIVSEAWFAMGEAARGQAEISQSLAAYSEAELTAGADGDPDLLWQVHYGRAKSLELSGDLETAVKSMESSIMIIESVRERLREERFRAGWVEDKYQVYIDLVRLQLELGRTRDAFSTAERLRARSFLTQLDRSIPAVPTGTESSQETVLRGRIRQLQKALAAEQQKAPPERRQPAIESFSSELKEAERDYLAFIDDKGPPATSSRSIGVSELAQIQDGLQAGAAIIEYVVDETGLVAFVMRQDSLLAVRSTVRREELGAGINLVRELIQQPVGQAWKRPALTLSAFLIAPLRQQGLLDGVTHIIVVPHGILNYLPFALLPLDNAADHVLIENFTLSYLPTAAMLLHPSYSNGSGRSLLALAPERSRLRFAEQEAASVVEMFLPNARLLAGKQATESEFKSRAGDYQVLHIATHGVFNKQNPLLSGLEFESDASNDGLLEVHEILALSLDAELVTLSACQTGLSSSWFTDIPAGDDFVGLARAFLVAGSQSVLASLWEVDDRSTGDLMQGFYRRLEQGGQMTSQADALAGIQRRLRGSKEFNHPFYWAPFVLVGPDASATSRGITTRRES